MGDIATYDVYNHEKEELLDNRLTRYDNDGKLIINIENIIIDKDDYIYLENTKFKSKIIGTIEINNKTPHYRR